MEENREKMEKTEKLTEEILYIQEEFDKIGVKLTNRQASQFKMYADLLVEWNSFMNLTAITDFKEIVQKHFIDSAAYVFLPDVSRETSEEYMIDVGTGAGFPGIPLKILYPQWKIVLMDSLNKRIKFTAVRRNWLKKRNTGSNFHFAFLAQWQIWRLYRNIVCLLSKKAVSLFLISLAKWQMS